MLKITVLIVDDDSTNLKILSTFYFLLSTFLERWGYSYSVASNGDEALELMELSEDFDIVLSDMMMPKVCGWELFEKIKANDQFSNITLIGMSTNEDKDLIERAKTCGATDFFVKPVEFDNLRYKLELISKKILLKTG